MAQSSSDAEPRPGARVPRRKLEAAMEEVAEYRRDFIRAQQMGAGADERLLRGYHAAVINYYEELRTYRNWSAVEEAWQTMRMWPVEEDGGLGVGYVLRDEHVRVLEDDDGNPRAELTEAGERVVLDRDWVRGVDAIESWMDREHVVTAKQAGLGRGEQRRVEPARMPPRILLAASRALDAIARELGLSVVDEDDSHLPAISDFDQSGEEPTAELTNAEYRRSPDL